MPYSVIPCQLKPLEVAGGAAAAGGLAGAVVVCACATPASENRLPNRQAARGTGTARRSRFNSDGLRGVIFHFLCFLEEAEAMPPLRQIVQVRYRVPRTQHPGCSEMASRSRRTLCDSIMTIGLQRSDNFVSDLRLSLFCTSGRCQSWRVTAADDPCFPSTLARPGERRAHLLRASNGPGYASTHANTIRRR